MTEIINKKRGESLSFAFLINAEYDMARIESSKAFIGAHSFDLVVNNHALECRLASTQTQAIYGKNELVLHLDDSVLGIVKISAGLVNLSATLDGLNNSSINTGLDLTVPITINETTIEVGDLLFNYVKGEQGDSAYTVAVDNGFVGTEEEWLLSLQGADGNGIESITLLSTVGLVKTYRILYTDATTFDYTVTDGADGEANNTILHENEVPSGLVNGSNAIFTLSNDCIAVGSFMVNSIPVTSYTRLNRVITLSFAPTSGSTVHCTYFENVTTTQDISTKVDKEVGKSLIADTEISRLASMTEIFTTALKSVYDAAVTTANGALQRTVKITTVNVEAAVDNSHTHSNKSILDAIQESLTTALKSAYDGSVSWITTNGTNILTHIGLTSGNPHNVTKSDVGLSNVDNTSDVNKPVSTAQNSAIANRMLKSNNLSDVSNVATARTNLGLGNVDNTSDANKPVSTAQATAIGLKQDALSFVTQTNNTYLRDDNTFQRIDMGASASNANLYFNEDASDISGYEVLSYEPNATQITETWSAASADGEKLLKNYLYPTAVGVDMIPSGIWSFQFYGKVSATAGTTQLGVTYFKRSALGVETDLFTDWSFEINNTTDDWFVFPTYTHPSYVVDPTDRMGARMLMRTTTAASKTITYMVGDGYGAFLVNPNKIRHSQLRVLNEDTTYQHIDASTEKETIIEADSIIIWDSVALKSVRSTFAHFKTVLGGMFAPKIASTTVTVNTAIDGTFNHIVSNGTSLSHTLPTAATYPNKEWTIYNENATDLTLVGTISGDSSITLQEGESLTFYSNGTNLIAK